MFLSLFSLWLSLQPLQPQATASLPIKYILISAYRMVCAVCLLVFTNQINSKLASLDARAHGDAT